MERIAILLSRTLTTLGVVGLMAGGVMWYCSQVQLSIGQESIKQVSMPDGSVQDHMRLSITNRAFQDVRLVAVAPLC